MKSFLSAFLFAAHMLLLSVAARAADVDHQHAFRALSQFMVGVWTNDDHPEGLRREHVYESTLDGKFVTTDAEQDPNPWHGYLGIHLLEEPKLGWWGFYSDGTGGVIHLTKYSEGRWEFEGEDGSPKGPLHRRLVIEQVGDHELHAVVTDTVAGETTVRDEVWQKHSLETTLADFEAYCELIKGRWVGKIELSTDREQFGTTGEVIAGHYSSYMAADDKVQIGTFVVGEATGKWIIYYDRLTKRTRILSIASDGGVLHQVVYKSDGKFFARSIGQDGAGRHRSSWREMAISNGGDTHTLSHRIEVDGKPIATEPEVWSRVSK